MAVNLVTKIIEMLKMAGIDYSKMAGKIDPNKVKQLVTKTQKTATKPKLIDALNKEKATFSDALKIFEDEAQYISQMNEMELANFANNLDDYFKVGGKKKNIPTDNVVTTEGTPVVGKKLEKLAERKGAKGEADTDSLQGGLQGLMSLVDEIKGISPKLRNQMDRDELAAFIQKMRGKKFTNEEIKWVREYLDDNYSLGFAKEKATEMQFGKKLGAKDRDEFEFVNEYVENLNTTSPKEFKEIYGNVKHVNMDISRIIDNKLEKHFKKKYKWDDTKQDGGLDDKTYELYESELFDTQKEFGNLHTVYDGGRDAFGMRKGRSWENHPNNYLDEASEKFESITGQGLNVDFLKSYTDDVLSKYPEPEKFQYGGPVVKGPDLGSTAHGSSELASRQRVLQPGGQMTTSTGLNYLLGEDDNNRIPFNDGLLVPPKKPFQGLFHTEVGGPVITKDDSEFEAVVDRWSQFARQKGEGPEGVERNKSFALENIVRIGREQGYEDDEIKEIILRINKKADGGRIGFAGGGMGRRGFLKLLGGTAAGIAAMKAGIVKLLGGPTTKKSIAKGITIPKTGGMPDWFEPLVNKVIREGENVTKQFATKEREIVNATKIGDDEMVTVYRDLDDGAVRVEYNSADNLAEGPVELKFTPGMADETTKGKKPPDEFTASEAEPEIVNWEGDIEWTGENFADDVKGLTSDTTKLKEYAVGKDQVTIKEIVESIKKKRRARKINENPTEQINYIEEKHGPAMDYIDETARVSDKFGEPSFYDTKGMNLPKKKAFGGRIGFAGGMVVKKLIEIASRIGLDFNKATDVQKQIIQKYGDRIDDKLLDYMVYDPNAQRQAEVMASIDQAEIMINKGMSPDDVIAAQEKSFRTKNASGGLAGMHGE